jgi:hypothetical protein
MLLSSLHKGSTESGTLWTIPEHPLPRSLIPLDGCSRYVTTGNMIDARADLLRLIGNLKKDMQDNPDRRPAQLAALEAALAAFDGEPLAPPAPSPYGSSTMVRLREGTKKEYFRSVVGQLIDEQPTGRVHRNEILERLKTVGIFAGTENLERAMSKYLSTDGTFASDGDGYWKRKPKGTADAPNEIKPQEASPTA